MIISAFLSGLLFSLGLIISGMVDPQVVKSFLNIAGEWKIDLLLVLVSAVGIYAVGYHFITKRSKPVFDQSFKLPLKKHIDRPLVVGAILFGLGWGLVGICPGPAIVAVTTIQFEFVVFFAAVSIGMYGLPFVQRIKFLKS